MSTDPGEQGLGPWGTGVPEALSSAHSRPPHLGEKLHVSTYLGWTSPASRPLADPTPCSRRVCTMGVSGASVSETFVQRVYQPYLTTCDGHRTCSTYRTIYRTAYRRSPGLTPTRPHYACCPGWKRTSGLPGACGAAVCQPPCGNGGSCVRPGQCRCPVGWQGDTCQTDVDECSTGEASCPQRCVNTVGSYWCQCWEGQSPSADGRLCLSKERPSPVAPNPTAGVDSMVREEVYRLQARVDVLEQVRLGWEWVLLVSTDPSLWGCGSKSWDGWEFYGERSQGCWLSYYAR
ncbi:epidermal growth factor-like protein 7 isoform X3 [Arvicanthis niloticus]|uniref:epidermal growth factor-like protein 7 isoform X3 n=1 Tax=Arvicanthis niloticus TaxID=61156 RepID=UPI00402B7436